MFDVDSIELDPSGDPSLRVLICDEHDLVRRSLTTSLEETLAVEVVAEAADAEEAIGEVRHIAPDLAFVSLVLPDRRGVEAIQIASAVMPGVRVVALAVEEEIDERLDAVRAGAVGVVDKEILLADAGAHVAALLDRRPAIDAPLAAALLERFDDLVTTTAVAPLTARERELLESVAAGRDPWSDDSALDMAAGEARNHLLNVVFRLHVGAPLPDPVVERSLLDRLAS